MNNIARMAVMMIGLSVLRAEAGSPFYADLPYRLNDPFVFCTQGQDPNMEPLPCWKPIEPYTGAFILMPYCMPFMPSGKAWTNDDVVSFRLYLNICPRAENSGAWKGAGRPERVPIDH